MRFDALLLLGFYFISSQAFALESHCSEQEEIVYSCSLNGNRIVSVCASKGVTAESGFIQYRFGVKGAPELIFPTSTEFSHRAKIQARSLMFAGGGGGYLRFINGQFNYIVYTAIGKGWGTKDGVAVEKKGKPIANLKCNDVPTSIIGDEFFVRAGLKTDNEEFSLP